MNNRNMLLFVVLSLGLLGGYSLLMNRLYPAPKKAPVQAVEAAPTPAAVPASPSAPAAAPAPTTHGAGPIEVPTFFEHENATLRLKWRVQDAALVQAIWKADGTKFFPEAQKDLAGGRESHDFPGLGGILATRFESVEQGADGDATLLAFVNGAGDRLTYRIPAKGHAMDLHWSTTRGTHLQVLPFPSDPHAVLEQGRVFSLDDKKIHAVTWSGMLHEPFFLKRIFGAKRDQLPEPTTRIGMDAGVEDKKGQTTFYFAVVWDLARMPERDLGNYPGYHVAPDTQGNLAARLYLGPKRASDLLAFHPEGQPQAGKPFVRVIDFGFFGVVAQVMFWLLHLLQGVVGNWGWTLLLFSFLLRMLLWPLNTKSTVQMLRMKDLEPQQKAIQAKYEKFGSDLAKKQEMQKELSEFYKRNGHNPLGGCLPMLIPMPIFFALWSMLQNVFELRHAPWLGWIKDLSSPDPFYVMPVLLGVSMFLQSWLTPATGDPAQRKIMLVLMPVMMVWFFSNTPTGLSMFWLVFNVVGIFQTWWLVKHYTPMPVKA